MLNLCIYLSLPFLPGSRTARFGVWLLSVQDFGNAIVLRRLELTTCAVGDAGSHVLQRGQLQTAREQVAENFLDTAQCVKWIRRHRPVMRIATAGELGHSPSGMASRLVRRRRVIAASRIRRLASEFRGTPLHRASFPRDFIHTGHQRWIDGRLSFTDIVLQLLLAGRYHSLQAGRDFRKGRSGLRFVLQINDRTIYTPD